MSLENLSVAFLKKLVALDEMKIVIQCKTLGNTHKLKGNSFYGKMIEDLMRNIRTTFTTNEDLVDKADLLISKTKKKSIEVV